MYDLIDGTPIPPDAELRILDVDGDYVAVEWVRHGVFVVDRLAFEERCAT